MMSTNHLILPKAKNNDKSEKVNDVNTANLSIFKRQ